MINRRSLCVSAAAGLGLAGLRAGAQTSASTRQWPEKPLHFICAYPPGGLSDQITRYVGERIARAVGQPVIVENKPGAGALVGTAYAAHLPPDGYNFFVAPTATVCVSPWLRKVNFALDDFVPIAKISSTYGLITARKDAPFSNYREFVAAARAAPGKFTWGSNGVGSIVHLTGVLLHKQAGIDVVHVPYKGSVEAMMDLLAGRIDVMYDPVTQPRVKDGSLKGLGMTNPERNPQLPNVPTLKEQGFDFDGRSWFGLFAPHGTAPEIVARMASETQKMLAVPSARSDLLISSMYPDFEGPAEFARRVHADSEFFRDIIQKENIKAD